MGMSFAYGPTDADEARATLERALELGVTLYDTADVYGQGDNEEFLSPFFRAHRDEVVIATKFAMSIPPDEPTRSGSSATTRRTSGRRWRRASSGWAST
jgi:aryl-alcohol dehydrogenase-like predicted oxidoreductase